ncbi:cAMP-mediated signaling protein sok1 [Coemansia sp. RSA 2336]|nr:cAMP-mediated signaling protein sok1 [Coemansia sp. RSA 2336]
MTESYAAQDNDYLTTHRAQTTSAGSSSPTTHGFLGSSNGSQSAVSDRSAQQHQSTTVEATEPKATDMAITSRPLSTEAKAADMAITSQPLSTEAAAPVHSPNAGSSSGSSSGSSNEAVRGSRPVAPCSAISSSSSRGGGRGIKRRGSDSCLELMRAQTVHGRAHKRRSLDAAHSAGINGQNSSMQQSRTAAGGSAAVSAGNVCTAHGHTAREPAHGNGGGLRQHSAGAAQRHVAGSSRQQTGGDSEKRGSPAQACGLPPVNRYTLRELKISSILQNPRLRHEVVFEPKLEFRPNSSGQLAETKQRAAMQYWAEVDQQVRAVQTAPTTRSVAVVTMLVVELREILAEMIEDGPSADASLAAEVRERIDETCVRQQLQHGVFDAAQTVAFMAGLMRSLAQPQRHAAIARLSVYVQRGRLARALRGAFDVLEAIKIDAANSGIELYRDFMRATAVAFERSHFSISARRGSITLSDTTAWWQRAVLDARARGLHVHGLDAVFFNVARDLVLDDSQSVPALFRMDDARIQTIRREAERLGVVGMVFLSFSQFLQLLARGNKGTRIDHSNIAAECLQLIPEGCRVHWAESLGSRKPPRGDVSFSQLVDGLRALAERILDRVMLPSEVAMLERTLLRAARHECPLREVVEDRVSQALCEQSDSLSRKRPHGETMSAAASEPLRRSMLLFLAPPLAALAQRIHCVLTHHWLVYKPFYTSVSGSKAAKSEPAALADSVSAL